MSKSLTNTLSKELLKSISSEMIDYALVQVRRCAEKYEFNMDEAEIFLGLRPVSQKNVKIALPFSREMVIESGCQGLAYNQGLFILGIIWIYNK